MNITPVSSFLEDNRIVRSLSVEQVRVNIGFPVDTFILDTNDDGIANFSMEIGDDRVTKTYWEPALASGYDFLEEQGESVYEFDSRSQAYRVGDHTFTRTSDSAECATRDLRPMAEELELEEHQEMAFRADTGEFVIYEPIERE